MRKWKPISSLWLDNTICTGFILVHLCTNHSLKYTFPQTGVLWCACFSSGLQDPEFLACPPFICMLDMQLASYVQCKHKTINVHFIYAVSIYKQKRSKKILNIFDIAKMFSTIRFPTRNVDSVLLVHRHAQDESSLWPLSVFCRFLGVDHKL